MSHTSTIPSCLHLSHVIFIDAGYFHFRRYHAMMAWWKLAHPEEPNTDLANNPQFSAAYKDCFVRTLKELPKKIIKTAKLPKHTHFRMIVGKDCRRTDIWRNLHFPQYKANREKDPEFQGKIFFKRAYDENWFQKGGVSDIVSHPQLEADDCIALLVRKMLLDQEDDEETRKHIFIITSDRDYLQLAGPHVTLYDLTLKNIAEKSSKGDPQLDLFCKIILGDPSDNIPPVFKTCGIKTAMKLFEDRDALDKRLNQDPAANERYKLNTLLVDFHEIPSSLADEFHASIMS